MSRTARSILETLLKANISKAIKNSLNDIDLGDVLSRTLKNNIKNSITGKLFRGLNDTDIKLKLKDDIKTSLDDITDNATGEDIYKIYDSLDVDIKYRLLNESNTTQIPINELIRESLD